jgi:hypothetical protein
MNKIVPLVIFICSNWLVMSAQIQTKNPGVRYGHDLAYDETRENVVLFGGFHNDGRPLGDTWIRGRCGWERTSIVGPSPRKWTATAFDANLGMIVLFGGRTGLGQNGKSLSDTWIWDGNKWSRLFIVSPPARDHHRMVYDRGRKKIVLFGGWNGIKLLGDTWEFDGSKWTLVSERGPAPRAPTALAYDERNEQVVLFGGKTLNEFFGDTWIWNGTKWSERNVQGPSARAFHAMTYNPKYSQVTLFSGRFEDKMLNDTWAWNGESWKKLDNRGPIKRGIYALIYDKKNEHLLFYGSGKRENGKWILDDETWSWKDDSWHLLR